MKLKIFINAVLFFILICSVPAQSQSGEGLCGVTSPIGGYRIPTKTPNEGEFVRGLFVYVIFSDDDFNGWGYTMWPNRFQNPSNPFPVNPHTSDNKSVANTVGSKSTPFMSRYENYTITDFFCEMSMGQLDLIGDEVYVMMPQSADYYKSHGFFYGSLNREVLEYLDATQTIDWTRYNNWTYNSNKSQWEFANKDDETAEMISITYRTIPQESDNWFFAGMPGVGATDNLGITPDLEFTNSSNVTTKITSSGGVTCTNRAQATGRAELIIEHEITHVMGLDHSWLGMMTIAHANTTYFMNPLERSNSNLEYIPDPPLITQTITDSLRDFISSGDVIKIPLPGTTGRYFWLTNNQKKSVYDGLSRGGKICYDLNFAEIDPYCPEGKGLYVYADNLNCISNSAYYLDIFSAEGKFDWSYDRTITVPPQNYEFMTSGGTFDIYKPTSARNISGFDEYKKKIYDNNNVIAYSYFTDDMCSQDGGYSISWDDRGDGKDAFNMGYEEVFSPYSNPSTRTCQTDQNYGLTIRLLSQNIYTGSIKVKVYINDNQTALEECPPSKPKLVKGSKYFSSPNNPKYNPKITWHVSDEPDFYNNGGYFTIYRGVTYDCNIEPASYLPIATVASTVNEFIDKDITLHEKEIGGEGCGNMLATFHYRISATDNNLDESIKSERVIVSGYLDQCFVLEDSGPGQVTNDLKSEKFGISNYPNPFNPITNIKFSLPKEGFVTIKVYDVVGRMIKELVSEFKEIGNYSVIFDGSDFGSGVYFYRIETAGFTDTKRMLLVK